MKVKEHSLAAQDRRAITEELLETTQHCHFCARHLTRASEYHVDFRKYDGNFLDTSAKNALLVCKECLVDRRKRPYHAYIDARFAELSAHIANITALKHASLVERNAASELVSPAPAPQSVPSVPSVPDAEPEQVSAPLTAPAPKKPTPVLDFDAPDFDEAVYSAWMDDDED